MKRRRLNMFIFHILHEYCNNLLTKTTTAFLNQNIQLEENREYELIKKDELQECLSQMKNRKSAGPGDIPVELVKYGGEEMLQRLVDLLNLCLTQQKTPKEWKVGIISSLFKKGNRKDPNCYRGICVTSSLSRLWGRLIQRRLRQDLGIFIGDDQSGFTPGRSCVDNNLRTLQQVMKKKR